MNQDYILLLPIAWPLLAGIVTFFVKKILSERKLFCGFVFAAMLLEVIFTGLCLTGTRSLMFWKITERLEISFRVDTVSKLFAALVVIVWLLVGTFAFEYMKHGEHEELFFGFYLIVEMALVALCFADNMITYYVFFELMTLTSLPLVLHEMTHKAVLAGLKYLFYSVVGAFMALFGIFFLSSYGALGSFAAGGILDIPAVEGNTGLLYVCAILMIVGFGTKAGMFPMHGWLPTAHPEAPAPASAVLSGIITKMGVLGIIRVVYFVIGPDLLRGSWVQYVWMGLALTTVFLGSMLAYKEKVTKKRFAFSTVSQVSYILFGLSCMHPVAFVGALLHVIFHSAIKNTLFMSAGAFIYKTGKTRVEELKAIGKEMPIVIWCFTLVSIALIGIPPTSGFISKWYLATGSLGTHIPVFCWLGPVILLISALLTAGYLLPITIRGFFPGHDFDYSTLKSKEPNALMTIPMLILTVAAVLLGMFPNGLVNLITSVAATIF
ncbi:MAG: proton-conducting membrane transporter [Lachnospiraceae bacterium]|nr:proton-conducting membrane transporter [Lachnospiraceae bacterium]